MTVVVVTTSATTADNDGGGGSNVDNGHADGDSDSHGNGLTIIEIF